MSIAEKLTTVAENVPKVYDAGKLATLKNSKYMNGKESGAIATATNVTPIEHTVGVKLSSDTITDFSGVEVARYGKNLWNEQWENGVYSTTTGKFVQKNNSICSNRNSPIFVKPNTEYYFISPQRLYVMFYDADNNFLSYKGAQNGILTTPNDCKYIKFYAHTDYGATYLNDICVCFGAVSTEYEPYIEPTTYTANTDGTVDGVKSISPSMTLIPNNNAVTVECEYLRDIDLYIDSLVTNVALTGGE